MVAAGAARLKPQVKPQVLVAQVVEVLAVLLMALHTLLGGVTHKDRLEPQTQVVAEVVAITPVQRRVV
jgi:hypothetical protein